MLEQWREIEMTIPSLDAHVRLAPVLRDEEIVVTAQEWGLLAALEGTPSVRDLIERRRQPMIEVCRDLKGLVDRGAIEGGVDLVATEVRTDRRPRPVAEAAPAHPIEPTAPWAPDVDDAISVAEVEAAAIEADAVAAGLVSRMTRSRPSVPDVFADDSDAEPVADEPSEEGDAVPVSVAADSDAGGRASEVDPSQADASQDRGALLRLFSALKET